MGGKSEPITAVAFAPFSLADNAALLALGFESGLIEFWSIPLNGTSDASFLNRIPVSNSHSATVTKLAWRPCLREASNGLLASVSADHGCRLHRVTITQ